MNKRSKSSKIKRWIMSGVVLLVVYLFMPVIAGFFQIGDRDGPRIYSSDYHTTLYILGYVTRDDGVTPRSSPLWRFTDRPLFYGMDRKFKSEKERAKLMKELESVRPEVLEIYREMAKRDYNIDL